MSQRNETVVLVLALLILAGLLVSSFWWLTRKPDLNLGVPDGFQPNTPNPTTGTPSSTPQPSPNID